MENLEIELTLRMPSEITLGSTMPVRCRGRILRVVRPVVASVNGSSNKVESKIGVAVRLECYEYLPEASETSGAFARISTLHPHREEEQPVVHSSNRG
jgi:hypothetical protein